MKDLNECFKENETFDMQAMKKKKNKKNTIHNTETAMQNKQTELDALFRRFPTF